MHLILFSGLLFLITLINDKKYDKSHWQFHWSYHLSNELLIDLLDIQLKFNLYTKRFLVY